MLYTWVAAEPACTHAHANDPTDKDQDKELEAKDTLILIRPDLRGPRASDLEQRRSCSKAVVRENAS